MATDPISIVEARERVLSCSRRLGRETVAIEQALGRVLAQNVYAAGEVPPFPSSAMDGYALEAGPAGRRLTVVGQSRAGAPFAGALRVDEAIRISTGAAVPPSAPAVIRQEDVDAGEGMIVTNVSLAAGENVRAAGEDMRPGSKVLAAGATVGAPELGVAVAAGAAELIVARRPTVAVLCTGDELRAPGEPLGPGQIHNSNAPMLAALASRAGAVVLAEKRVADDLGATEDSLGAALRRADVVVVSGGVSVGPHDHLKRALADLGVREQFWRVALQPGGPTWFGELDGRLVFGLPGNPVSAYVTFSLFARPAIAALQGASTVSTLDSEALLGVAVARNRTRERALRVRLERRDGSTIAVPNGPQGSHILTSLVGADALALIPPGEGELAAGSHIALERLPR